MSEIAKCPNCKGVPVVAKYSGLISCCAMQADANNLEQSIKLWNQYAAAMELARLTFTWQETMPDSFRDHIREELKRAESRVLEVFGGE
jgi:hypothetical protein